MSLRAETADRPTTGPPASSAGLTDAEAAARRAAGEGNEFAPPTSRSYLEILRENAYPGINGVLLSVSLVLILFGLFVEALLTAGPVVANIVVGVVQESRAKRKLDHIALLSRPRAAVVRGGEERSVDPAEIVRGDIVVARRGDQIVVDGTLVGGGSLELDESLLTGEADPVTKGPGDPVLSGTAVISGTATYVAERVGADSVANRMLAEARRLRSERTPLQREIARTIWIVAGLVILTAIPVAFALPSLPAGYPVQEALNAAAVLVTLVPQGLAIMITVTYAAGALRITRLGALVQQQHAIESMSRVDTLCVDKTGTLTTQRIAFEGAEGLASTDGPDAAILDTLLGAVAASATARNRTTDALAAALPDGVPLELEEEIPFASERRWSAVRFASAPRLVDDPALVAGLTPDVPYVLGAPVALRTSIAGARDELDARASAIAATGTRVLLLAAAPAGTPLRDAAGEPTLPPDLVPVALLSFSEELRPDAGDTLGELADAGVQLKVISGDDPTTVEAIGRRVSLAVEGGSRSGTELARLDDDALAEAAATTTVFGRIEPAMKARLIGALRSRGRYVAMIGDGVNDLLPLRRAQLGIAMESGSAATRGAADLVLLGDAFGVLPRAVVEGQRIIAAMQATLVLLLSRTFYVLLIVAAAAVAGLPFPLTPRQNSILAFATVGIPLIVLALWVPPRQPPASLLGASLRISVPAALGVSVVALPVYWIAGAAGLATVEARTILTTVTVFCGLGLLPLIQPARSVAAGWLVALWPWLLAGLMLVIYVAILHVPIARDFYELTPLQPSVLAALAAIGVAWTVFVQVAYRSGVVGSFEDRLGAAARRFRRRTDAA